jgi:hypothetical protein
MSYNEVQVSAELLDEFKHILPELEKKYERKWENY